MLMRRYEELKPGGYLCFDIAGYPPDGYRVYEFLTEIMKEAIEDGVLP